jgi:hypothetical protein
VSVLCSAPVNHLDGERTARVNILVLNFFFRWRENGKGNILVLNFFFSFLFRFAICLFCAFAVFYFVWTLVSTIGQIAWWRREGAVATDFN